MNGATPPTGTNGSPSAQPIRRKKPPVNPLVANRRPKPKATRPLPSKPQATPARTTAFTQKAPDAAPEGVKKYPVFTTKRALLENLRYHIARMQFKGDIDITDDNTFTRPVRLHRRDPASKPINEDEPVTPDPEDIARQELEAKEQERVEALKAENKRIREENQKQIAPTIASTKKKANQNRRKVQPVYRPNDDPEATKKHRLRYEETYPWHIEDDDNKQVWMGTFEQALSDCHLLFVQEKGQFSVLPLQKYYRFKEKGKTKQLDLDMVDELMKAKKKEPRFIMLKKLEIQKANKEKALSSDQRFAKKGAKMFKGENQTGMGGGGEDGMFGGEDAGAPEEVDFENDELFADDDEDQLVEIEDEDELKETIDKIKREQLGANYFDVLDEEQVDKEEDLRLEREQKAKADEKRMRKALLKREGNYNYEADSDDENPYASDSDDTSSEKEENEEETSSQKPKEEEEAVTKGDSTPSGRKKTASTLADKVKRSGDVEMSEASGNESTKNKKKSKTLKRPGSPDISGVSGNESSRKKQKVGDKSNLKAPMAPNRKVSALKGAGSGSESESGPRGLHRMKSSKGPSPSGSRAQSPAGRANASRSGSPAVSGLPSSEEIIAAIPVGTGIKVGELSALFKKRVAPSDFSAFIQLVRSVANWDKKSQLVTRKS
ncbi:Rap30/74 interaction domain-containing protein [Microthyrium microscopicum]|uniref:Rap30/74 interaction domain-containing protein n=1 Tax=Microthyrium microscopicum TaxID=703497 RepID=A0A6A6UR25_9PEZI|nr:Rap30/74 interaction domain-containing protein [Microthyrium microscopicum]